MPHCPISSPLPFSTTAHKALTNVVNSTTYQISKAYVLCNDNVKKVGKITYLPIYMLMFIKKEQKLPTKYSIDLNGLV